MPSDEEFNLKLVLAKKENVQALCTLLNLAYRGDRGWTTESSLVSGDRAVDSDIESVIVDNNSRFLIYQENGKLIACICIEMNGAEAHIGSFAVHPNYQETGLGKKVLSAAESYALEELGANNFIMVVLSSRNELVAFYERRGYKKNGVVKNYPTHLNLGVPKISGLTIEYLVKKV
jgi:ribosomal protein S18 acetylase RimI-like enzyme